MHTHERSSLETMVWVAIAAATMSCHGGEETNHGNGAAGGNDASSAASGGGATGGGASGGAGGAGASSGAGGAEEPLPPPPEWMASTHALAKLRPHDPLPANKHARIDAARNEFEPFQIALAGGESGHSVQAVALSTLKNADGDVIDPSSWVVHREGLFDVPGASSAEGDPGLWPDPLIPDVDPYFGEKRNAFPLEVPAGELRALWLEVLVPADATPGEYEGQARITTDEGDFGMPITLRVRNFSLPSTSSLPTAFGGFMPESCPAHASGYESCGDAIGGTPDEGVEYFKALYARVLLDHRITMANTLLKGPPDTPDFSHFDAVVGDLLEGTAPTRLSGARLTTFRIRTKETSSVQAWRDHFTDKGWTAMPFDYTCDEPPAGCSFSEIPAAAAPVQAGGVRTLVTTSLSRAQGQGVLDAIDILVPLIGSTNPVTPGSAYGQWLAADPKHELWWYQSCESHGCGSGCGDGSQASGYPPSYVIDALAVQARAMEWLTFTHNIGGELYYQTVEQLATAWDDQCGYDGAGDGTLFYPGTPARIGGTHDLPVTSLRLALIREGLEDYEYLHRLRELGDEDFAKDIATTLFPDRDDVRIDPEALYAARAQLADRLETLSTP